MRITDIYGQSVTVDGVAMAPDQVQRTSARLYGPGSGSGSAPPPAPMTTPPPTTTTAVATTQPATSADPSEGSP